MERGGNGGEKIWWESDTVGDLFELSLNESASIAIEVYTHHSLPMGQVIHLEFLLGMFQHCEISVYVDGNFAKTIDACCEKPCVGVRFLHVMCHLSAEVRFLVVEFTNVLWCMKMKMEP